MREKRERDRRHEKRKEECMRGFTVVSICVKCGAAINVPRTSQGGREGKEIKRKRRRDFFLVS